MIVDDQIRVLVQRSAAVRRHYCYANVQIREYAVKYEVLVSCCLMYDTSVRGNRLGTLNLFVRTKLLSSELGWYSSICWYAREYVVQTGNPKTTNIQWARMMFDGPDVATNDCTYARRMLISRMIQKAGQSKHAAFATRSAADGACSHCCVTCQMHITTETTTTTTNN